MAVRGGIAELDISAAPDRKAHQSSVLRMAADWSVLCHVAFSATFNYCNMEILLTLLFAVYPIMVT